MRRGSGTRAERRAKRVRRAAITVLALGAAAIPSFALSRATDGPHLASVAAQRPWVTVGSAASIPARARMLGPMPADRALSVELVLAPRRAAELRRLVADVTTPGSLDYRRYLGRGTFKRRFAPSAADVRGVERALARLGVRGAHLGADGFSLHVRATARTLERALRTPLVRFRLASGETVTANVDAPRLPASIAAHVSAVLGLDASATASPTSLVLHAAPERAALSPQATGPAPTSTCNAAAGGPSSTGLTPDQIAGAYGMSSLYAAGDLGSGATVAVIEFSPFVASDIATYEQCYGITSAPPITTVTVDGGPKVLSLESEVEAELDIEDVIGLAPAASVLVYEGSDPQGDVSDASAYDAYAKAIDDDRAEVISTSWGECESATGTQAIDAENVLFEQAALQGQSVVAAAGDDGSEDCFVQNRRSTYGLAVDDPASQPFVTGVGGTALTVSPYAETAWNTGLDEFGSPGAGGGGLSSVWPAPSYQSDATAPGVINAYSRANPCKAKGDLCREVPDVSANAGTPYAIYCTMSDLLCDAPQWTAVGGTSAAAPTIAALLALADVSSACRGTAIGFANPALYAIAAGSGYSTAFNDVTTGNNDLTGTNGGSYPATVGYDLATGLGTPIAGSGTDGGLVAQLCAASSRSAIAAALPRPAVTKVSPGKASTRGGARVTISGTNFLAVKGVHFGLRSSPAFTVVSATKIVTTAPKGSGAVHVTVINRAGTSDRVRADVFHYEAPPSLTSVSPRTGPGAGGTTVRLIGWDFAGATAVRFGHRTALRFRVVTSSKIVAVAPPGAGSQPIEVVTPFGTSKPAAKNAFVYRP